MCSKEISLNVSLYKKPDGSKRAVGGAGVGGREEEVRQTRTDRDEKEKKKHVKM